MPSACPNCQFENPDGARFCFNCAIPLDPTGPHPGMATAPQQQMAPPSRPRRSGLPWAVAALVVLAVIAAVVAFFVVSGGDDSSNSDTTTSTGASTTLAGGSTTLGGDTTTIAGQTTTTGPGTTTATSAGEVTTTTQAINYVDEPITGPLRLGHRGERVKALQSKLNDLGLRKGSPDGKFGPVTEQAVKTFQHDNGLSADGIAGPQTFKKLGIFYPKAIEPGDIPTIAASTTNDPSGSVDYEIDNVLDGKSDTAWQSAGGEPPEGNTIDFTFDNTPDIKQIATFNGYEVPARDTRFEENSRIEELKITSGTHEVTVTLDDTKDVQYVSLDFGPIDTLTFEIVSVYPGNHYTEVALTDVVFLVDANA